jgi:hypothetical protein
VSSVTPSHPRYAHRHSDMIPSNEVVAFPRPEPHTFFIYENELPKFVEVEMERLYENIHSSVPKLRADSNADNVSTYVLRRGERIKGVLVFRWRGNRVEVINECIKLDGRDIQLFANAIFSTYPSAAIISFHAVQASIERLHYPYQCFTCLEDIVLKLPVSSESYFSSLGKSTRQNISHYRKAVQRDFASYHFRICSQQELTETLIRDIVSLSNARIAAKDQVSLHDEEKTKQLIKLVQLHGFVGLITIDGRVCAGAICSKLGANYFLHVLAHDPLYDRYSLGTLCCYLTICESIARAGQTFHFLWGRMDYKYRLQGVQCDLQRVVVYRSRQQFFLNAAHALKITFKGLGRLVKVWLLAPERKNSFVPRIIVKLESATHRIFGKLLSG